MRPTARSLILDLLSTTGRRTMPVGALVEAARAFGLEENNLRVSLARLYAAGAVERDERGQYRLGPTTEAVREQIGSWRQLTQRLRIWRGDWIGIHTAGLPRGRGRARRRREQALRLLGFRALTPGLALRPDNLTGGIDAVRERLLALGLDAEALVFVLRDLDPARDLAARSLWDGDALSRDYTRSCRTLAESEARLPALSTTDAMVESFLIGGRAIRQLVLDPLLPEPLVRASARQALVDALRRYDEVGRACWAEFMAAHGLRRTRTPADLQLGEGGAHLSTATANPSQAAGAQR